MGEQVKSVRMSAVLDNWTILRVYISGRLEFPDLLYTPGPGILSIQETDLSCAWRVPGRVPRSADRTARLGFWASLRCTWQHLYSRRILAHFLQLPYRSNNIPTCKMAGFNRRSVHLSGFQQSNSRTGCPRRGTGWIADHCWAVRDRSSTASQEHPGDFLFC